MAATLKSVADALEFSVDARSGETIITIRDTATNTVVRTIPNREVIEIARALDRMQGILLRLKA